MRFSRRPMTFKKMSCSRSTIGKYRNQLWFVVFACFLSWMLLVYLHYLAKLDGKNGIVLLLNNGSNYIDSSLKFSNGKMSILPVTSKPIDALKIKDEPVNESINGEDDQIEDANQTSVFWEMDEKNEGPVVDEVISEKGVTEVNTILSAERGVQSKNDAIVTDQEPVVDGDADKNGVERGNGIQEIEPEPVVVNQGSRIQEVESNNGGMARETEPEPEPEPVLDEAINKNRVKQGSETVIKQAGGENESDPCSGKYVYIHHLPRKYNEDMLRHCNSLSAWTDMCLFLSNMGLGPVLRNSERAFSNTGWYATNQFSLEVIFHNRMKQYNCLTTDSSLASAIFVPFYPGLDVARYLWEDKALKDTASTELSKWLAGKPEWKEMWGRNHFAVAGRISWDFRRQTNNVSQWGNGLMYLPAFKNMSMLVIESSPWHRNDFAVPYPTYFHPSSDNEVFQWQRRMRRQKRRYLFSFAGGPRPNLPGSIRNRIIGQCSASRRKCKLLECGLIGSKCHKPVNVMKMFQSSVFCLQPPGDSYTRRSTFDSILAGCIPVFFHPGSAYVQYSWHLPRNYTKYSVFIPGDKIRKGKASIEKILNRISRQEIVAMRDEVIRLIPRVVYANPKSRLETLEDAFDIAVKAVLGRVETVRRDMREGRSSSFDFEEEMSWKYNLLGTAEADHEWDPFFDKTNPNVNF